MQPCLPVGTRVTSVFLGFIGDNLSFRTEAKALLFEAISPWLLPSVCSRARRWSLKKQGLWSRGAVPGRWRSDCSPLLRGVGWGGRRALTWSLRLGRRPGHGLCSTGLSAKFTAWSPRTQFEGSVALRTRSSRPCGWARSMCSIKTRSG